MRVGVFLLMLLCRYQLGAVTSFDKPIKTMAFLNGSLMATPTRSIEYAQKAGKQTFSLRPVYFEADTGVQTYDGARWGAEFKGGGFAAEYHGQLTSRFGFYVLAMFNQISSGEFLGRGSDPSNELEDIYSLDVSSHFFQTSLGLTWQVINGSNIALEVMAGPSFTNAYAKQRVYQADPSDPEDYEMEMAPQTMGYVYGVQAGIKLSKYLSINPYYMVSASLGEKCSEYKITSSVHLGNDSRLSDYSCDASHNELKLEYDISFTTFGVNIGVPAWGVSINVYTELEQIPGIEGTEPNLYYITLTL